METVHHTTLVNVDDLRFLLEQPNSIVIDCRYSLADVNQGRREYLKSHIPGARYSHLDQDMSGTVTPGVTGRHPLPDPATLAGQFSAWGISGSSQVIVYDASSGGIAGRLWWLLNWLGHDRVAILNGGWPAWIEAGFPLSSEEPEITPTDFDAPESTGKVFSTGDIERIASDPEWLIVDARAAIRYTGHEEPLDPVAGHIPGAISAPWMENLDQSGRFLSRSKLRERYETLIGEHNPEKVVFHCGSGVTAAHSIVAMRHAGFNIAGLYAGSWSEWITDIRRPIALGNE